MTPIQDKLFLAALAQAGIPAPVAEFRFHPIRKWRFDFCWPDQKLALEIDGAVWTGGRHTRGSGWMKDTEKLNAAAILGFRMLRCSPQQSSTSAMIESIKSALTYSPLSSRCADEDKSDAIKEEKREAICKRASRHKISQSHI